MRIRWLCPFNRQTFGTTCLCRSVGAEGLHDVPLVENADDHAHKVAYQFASANLRHDVLLPLGGR